MKLVYILAFASWAQTAAGFAPSVSFGVKSQALLYTKSPEASQTNANDVDWIAQHFMDGMPDEVDEALQAMQEGAKHHVFDWYSTATPASPNKAQQVSSTSSFGKLENFAMAPTIPEVASPVNQCRPLTSSAARHDAAPPLEHFRRLEILAEAVQVAPSLETGGAHEWFSYEIGLNPTSRQKAPVANRGIIEWFTDARPTSKPQDTLPLENFHRLVPSAESAKAAPSLESLRTFAEVATTLPGAAASLEGPKEWFSTTATPIQPQAAPMVREGRSDWFSQAIFAQ
jgi:hypothetical protein